MPFAQLDAGETACGQCPFTNRGITMSNPHAAPWPSGDGSLPEVEPSPQAAQHASETVHELRDEQLQSIVGGLRKLQVIRVIGFEN